MERTGWAEWREVGAGLHWKGCWNQNIKNQSIGLGTASSDSEAEKELDLIQEPVVGPIVSGKKSWHLPPSIWRCHWKEKTYWSFMAANLGFFISPVTEVQHYSQSIPALLSAEHCAKCSGDTNGLCPWRAWWWDCRNFYWYIIVVYEQAWDDTMQSVW